MWIGEYKKTTIYTRIVHQQLVRRTFLSHYALKWKDFFLICQVQTTLHNIACYLQCGRFEEIFASSRRCRRNISITYCQCLLPPNAIFLQQSQHFRCSVMKHTFACYTINHGVTPAVHAIPMPVNRAGLCKNDHVRGRLLSARGRIRKTNFVAISLHMQCSIMGRSCLAPCLP